MDKTLEDLHHLLDSRSLVVSNHERRYNGDVAISLIDARTRKRLGDRLMSMSVNFCGLAVDMLAERLRISGFLVNGQPDHDLWQRWQAAGMAAGVMHTHSLALSTGSSFVSVWAQDGQPMPMAEHPAQVIVKRHPTTRQPVAALKRWQADNYGWAVLYEPASVTTYRTSQTVPEAGALPPQGWEPIRVYPNPLGVVPVVPFVNSQRLSEPHGTSEMTPIADLADSVAKLLIDQMVASESFAKPRRTITGMEIQVDDKGRPIDPFSHNNETVQAEGVDAKFGQLAPSDLRAYSSAVELMVRQIGALSGLSPQMLGLHADSAMSADAIRAAEASLTSKAEARQTMFSPAWSRVAALMLAIRDNRPVHSVRVEPIWADPSTRSEAQAADAATKLFTTGLLSREAALQRLGYAAEDIAAIEKAASREAALRSIGGA